jgi:hypothetical protein
MLSSISCVVVADNNKKRHHASGAKKKRSHFGSSVVSVLNSASRWSAHRSSRVSSSVGVDASEKPVSSVVVERPSGAAVSVTRASWFARKTEPVLEVDHEEEDALCYSGKSMDPSVSVTAALADSDTSFVPALAMGALVELMHTYEVDGVRYNNLTESARALSSKLAASARSIFRDSVPDDTKSCKCIVEEFDISQQSLSSHNGGYMSANSSLYAPDDTGERYVPLTKAREELAIIDF